MALRSWIRNVFVGSNGRGTAAAKKAKRLHLSLECLEERAVPAGFFNVQDILAQVHDGLTGFHKTGDFDVGAYNPQLVAVGSFNSNYDNTPDLFVTNADGSYSVLLGDGAGHFSFTQGPQIWGIKVPVSFGGVSEIDGLRGSDGNLTAYPEGLATGDFNGDGRTDVAVAAYGNPTGAVKVLFGNGNGQFVVGYSLELPAGTGPTYLSAADLDKDGHTDLVVSDFNGNKVLIYRNLGGGSFELNDYNYQQNGVSNPEQTVVADFDGDGNLDIAVANNGNGSVSLFRGLGGGKITSAGSYLVQANSPVGLAAGDLNGDGVPDLAVASYGKTDGSGTLSLLQNTSTPDRKSVV